MKKVSRVIITGLVFSLIFVFGNWASAAQTSKFPIKGKPITWIVPYNPGIAADTGVRLLAPIVEKELENPIEIINVAGAVGQIGITRLVRANPDGYTISLILLPTTATMYLDPNRKAVFNRQSFIPVANHVLDPGLLAVLSSSPFKTVKDLVDAALANPGKITVSDGGLFGDDHFNILHLEKLSGAKFAIVHMSDGRLPAFLGGHTAVYSGKIGSLMSQIKSGEVRILGVSTKEPHPLLPGVKTMIEQGYNYTSSSLRGYVLPAGTPKEVVDIWASALKKAMENPEHISKMNAQGIQIHHMGPSEYAAYWENLEPTVKMLMEMGGKK